MSGTQPRLCRNPQPLAEERRHFLGFFEQEGDFAASAQEEHAVIAPVPRQLRAADARPGVFQAAAARKLDRFGRSLRHLVNTLAEFERADRRAGAGGPGRGAGQGQAPEPAAAPGRKRRENCRATRPGPLLARDCGGDEGRGRDNAQNRPAFQKPFRAGAGKPLVPRRAGWPVSAFRKEVVLETLGWPIAGSERQPFVSSQGRL